MVVRTDRLARKKGEKRLRDYIGMYYTDRNEAYLLLKEIKEWVEMNTGACAPEHLLIRAIVETACHETLHSLVRSGGPNADDREHRAIARLMGAAGMSWRHG